MRCPATQPVVGGTRTAPRYQNQAMPKWSIWDPNDLQLFPGKKVGTGFTINMYWMRHPLTWWRATHTQDAWVSTSCG